MLRAVRDLLFPWPLVCVHCGGKTGVMGLLCDNCAAKLDGDIAIRSFAVSDGISKSAAAHNYSGAAGALVRTFKYDGIISLREKMANDMLAAMNSAGIDRPDMIAFVPMHWRRRRVRHYNQAEVLARKISNVLEIPVCRDMRRVRQGRQQALITTPEERHSNISGAFRAGKSSEGKRVLLIDDVYTTGATSGECARALIDAGALIVDLAVYACAGHTA